MRVCRGYKKCSRCWYCLLKYKQPFEYLVSKMSSSSTTLFPNYQGSPSPTIATLNPLLCRSQDSPLPRRSRSPNFLASVKGLVHRSRSPARPQTSNERVCDVPSIQESSSTERCLSVPFPHEDSRPLRPSTQRRRKRRENVPSMIDYLTLSQLENVWHRQDTYKGVVYAPQRAPQWNAFISGLRSEEHLQTPHIEDHPAYRRYNLHDNLARSR